MIVSSRTTAPRITAPTGVTYAYVETSDVRALRSNQRYDVNPSHEPNTIRYASARTEARENVDVSIRPNSPATALRTMRMTPAASICIPALTNVRRGSGARRW